ncbi:MAG: helix-turn-helix domain-containing protein [Bacteroidia bacterium]
MRTEYKTGDYTIQETTIDGLRLCYQKFHAHSDVPLFKCDEPVFILPRKGRYCLRNSGQKYDIESGALLLVQNKAVRPLEAAEAGTEVFVFTIPYTWYMHYGLVPLTVSPAVYKQRDELYDAVLELLNEFLRNTPDALLYMDSLLGKIIVLLFRQPHPAAYTFTWQAAFEAMKDELCKKMKSAKMLAAQFGIEHRRFLKEFKQAYGCTPKAFANKKKLKEAAAMLLANRTKDIKYISDSLGFPDPGTFNREFKKEFDKTPGDYRRDNPPA